MLDSYKELDNPVWYAISEVHQNFGILYNAIKFYHPDYCPFGAALENENIANNINEYANLINSFYIVGSKPIFAAPIKLKNELVCLQMIIESAIPLKIQAQIIKLDDSKAPQLFQLVNLVQPGYFKSKTRLLGNYYGIFKNNELIAVTGERMKMNRFTEVSAVVTHPNHSGNGYAQQLVAHTVNEIITAGKIPFLHVAETNVPAIKLYEKLGFKIRRKISFWNLIK